MSSLHECRARGAKIILIHEQGDSIASEGDVSIPIPKSHEIFSPLISVVPLQLIAYHTALKLGKNVDRPRKPRKIGDSRIRLFDNKLLLMESHSKGM